MPNATSLSKPRYTALATAEPLNLSRFFVWFPALVVLAGFPGLQDSLLVPRLLLLSVGLVYIWGRIVLAKPADPYLHINLWLAIPIAVLVLLSLASISWATNPTEAFFWAMRNVLVAVWILTCAHLMATGRLPIRHVALGIALAVGLSVFMGIIGIAMHISDFQEKPQVVVSRHGNKNLFSSFLLLGMPWVWLAGRQLNRQKWAWLALGFIALLLIMLRTRAALLGLAVGSGAMAANWFFYHRPQQRGLLWAALLAASLVIAGGSAYLYRQNFHVNDTSTKERLNVWRNTLGIIKDNPALGVGTGNWQVAFPGQGLYRFQYDDIYEGRTTFQRPHNDYLWVWSELGPLGLLAMLFLGGYALRAFWRKTLSQTGLVENLPLLGGMAGFVIISLLDFPMERTEHMMLIGLYLAAAPQALHGWRKLSMPAGVGLIICLALVFGFTQRILGERSVVKMQRAHRQGRAEVARKEAEFATSHLVSLDYTSCPVQWYAGQALATQGSLKDAIPYFEQAREAHPNHLQTLSDLASCYQRTGRQAQAIATYKDALAISPKFTDANLNLAVAYYKVGQMDSALLALCTGPFMGYENVRFKTIGRTLVYFELDRIGQKYPNDTALQTRVAFLKDYGIESLQILRPFWHNPALFEDSVRHYPYYRIAETRIRERKGLSLNDVQRGEPAPVRP